MEMEIRTQHIGTEPFSLPEGSLCLSGTGWRYGPLDLLTISMEGRTNLEGVMNYLMAHQGNPLGDGVVSFYIVDKTVPMQVQGYLVFTPREDV